MKIIVILFLLVGFGAFSQLPNVAYNNTPAAARFISNSYSSVSQTIIDQPGCQVSRTGSGPFPMYFYYRAASTHVSTPDPSLFTISASSGAVDCSVKVWGPYASKDVAVSEYSSDSALVEFARSSSVTVAHDLSAGKVYLMEVEVYDCSAVFSLTSLQSTWLDDSPKAEGCIGCITGFRPQAGNYVLSAWVMDADAPLGTVSYSQPTIQVTSNSVTVICTPTGEIIDGWQRIEQEIYIGDEDPQIDLVCGEDGNCYFDDIRIFPRDGSMVTYVYDPVTLRLMAELDERNYAKIYEYDEQGKLIRVKKETEMGVMTIQENRENNSKE